MSDFFMLIFIGLLRGYVKVKAKMGSKSAKMELIAMARQDAEYEATMAAIRKIGDEANRVICDMAGIDYDKTADQYFRNNLGL
jgi:hypothetical protein